MNAKPTASVIVPVLNGEATIGGLLTALKGQVGMPGGLQIIVVDNGSTDRTVEVVRAHHDVLLLHQPKPGPAAARNLGLAQAQGDVILCIDSDCLPTRRWAASLIAAISNPEVGLATGPILGWQPTTPAERYVCNKGYTEKKHTAEHPKHPFAHGMHTTIRRADILAVGGWDETMGSGEDVDLCFKLRKRFGKPIVYVEDAIMFHKHRASDEALWRQARWHGAGFALLSQRHPDIVKWRLFHTLWLHVYLRVLQISQPLIRLFRRLRLISAERAEFESYHRRWLLAFWGGCIEQWKKQPA